MKRLHALAAILCVVSLIAATTPATAQMPADADGPAPQQISCAMSKLQAPGQENCRVWRHDYQSNVGRRPTVWFEDTAEAAECIQDRGAVSVRTQVLTGFVRYILSPDSSPAECGVGGRRSVTLANMRAIGPATRSALDLSFPQEIGDKFVSSFHAANGSSCRAFMILGPHSSNRRGSDMRQYKLLGYFCAAPGALLDEAAFLQHVAAISFNAGS